MDEPQELHGPLVENGPVAFRSTLPLSDWVQLLRQRGTPAAVSFHAGTYLCNATLYLTHYLAEKHDLKTQATFIHLPLDTLQAANVSQEVASLPASIAAAAIENVVEMLVRHSRLRGPTLA